MFSSTFIQCLSSHRHNTVIRVCVCWMQHITTGEPPHLRPESQQLSQRLPDSCGEAAQPGNTHGQQLPKYKRPSKAVSIFLWPVSAL